jgi:hypothetical protein
MLIGVGFGYGEGKRSIGNAGAVTGISFLMDELLTRAGWQQLIVLQECSVVMNRFFSGRLLRIDSSSLTSETWPKRRNHLLACGFSVYRQYHPCQTEQLQNIGPGRAERLIQGLAWRPAPRVSGWFFRAAGGAPRALKATRVPRGAYMAGSARRPTAPGRFPQAGQPTAPKSAQPCP